MKKYLHLSPTLGKNTDTTILNNNYNKNYMKKRNFYTSLFFLKVPRMLKQAAMFALTMFISSTLFAGTYYWNGGTFTTATNWTTVRAGGGSTPTGGVFTNAGDIFIVQGTGATTNGVGTGASNQTLAAGSVWTVSGTVEIEGGATLSSTVNAGLAIVNIIIDGNSTTFGTLSTSGSGTVSSTGTTTCKGVMNLLNTSNTNSFGILTVSNPASQATSVSINPKTLNCSGAFTVNSGAVVTFAGASSANLSGATTCNGTINVTNTSNTVAFTTISGTGLIYASRAFTATVAGSTFLAASGGTVQYVGLPSNLAMLSTYNNLTVDDNGQNRTYTPAPTTVNGNMIVSNNATANIFKQGTGALTVNGNLTIGTLATFTNQGNVTTVLGNVTQNGLQTFSAGGSITMGGTTQTLSGIGSFVSVIVASGSTTSLASNISVTTTGTLSVPSGGALNFSTFVLSGAGTLTVASGGTVQTSSTGTNGLATNITNTIKTLNSGANYVFNAATTAPFGSLLNSMIQNTTQ